MCLVAGSTTTALTVVEPTSMPTTKLSAVNRSRGRTHASELVLISDERAGILSRPRLVVHWIHAGQPVRVIRMEPRGFSHGVTPGLKARRSIMRIAHSPDAALRARS